MMRVIGSQLLKEFFEKGLERRISRQKLSEYPKKLIEEGLVKRLLTEKHNISYGWANSFNRLFQKAERNDCALS